MLCRLEGSKTITASIDRSMVQESVENGLHISIPSCGHEPSIAVVQIAGICDIMLFQTELLGEQVHRVSDIAGRYHGP